jgi:Regulator of Ty1 transposition protein 107 BRCT domain
MTQLMPDDYFSSSEFPLYQLVWQNGSNLSLSVLGPRDVLKPQRGMSNDRKILNESNNLVTIVGRMGRTTDFDDATQVVKLVSKLQSDSNDASPNHILDEIIAQNAEQRRAFSFISENHLKITATPTGVFMAERIGTNKIYIKRYGTNQIVELHLSTPIAYAVAKGFSPNDSFLFGNEEFKFQVSFPNLTQDSADVFTPQQFEGPSTLPSTQNDLVQGPERSQEQDRSPHTSLAGAPAIATDPNVATPAPSKPSGPPSVAPPNSPRRKPVGEDPPQVVIPIASSEIQLAEAIETQSDAYDVYEQSLHASYEPPGQTQLDVYSSSQLLRSPQMSNKKDEVVSSMIYAKSSLRGDSGANVALESSVRGEVSAKEVPGSSKKGQVSSELQFSKPLSPIVMDLNSSVQTLVPEDTLDYEEEARKPDSHFTSSQPLVALSVPGTQELASALVDLKHPPMTAQLTAAGAHPPPPSKPAKGKGAAHPESVPDGRADQPWVSARGAAAQIDLPKTYPKPQKNTKGSKKNKKVIVDDSDDEMLSSLPQSEIVALPKQIDEGKEAELSDVDPVSSSAAKTRTRRKPASSKVENSTASNAVSPKTAKPKISTSPSSSAKQELALTVFPSPSTGYNTRTRNAKASPLSPDKQDPLARTGRMTRSVKAAVVAPAAAAPPPASVGPKTRTRAKVAVTNTDDSKVPSPSIAKTKKRDSLSAPAPTSDRGVVTSEVSRIETKLATSGADAKGTGSGAAQPRATRKRKAAEANVDAAESEQIQAVEVTAEKESARAMPAPKSKSRKAAASVEEIESVSDAPTNAKLSKPAGDSDVITSVSAVSDSTAGLAVATLVPSLNSFEELVPIPSSTPKARILFTKVSNIDELEAIVTYLGGEVTQTISNATHVVAETVLRTEKFLVGLNSGMKIVTPKWLEESKRAGKFVLVSPENKYAPSPQANTSIDLNPVLLHRSKPVSLFSKLWFYFLPNYQSTSKEMLTNVIQAGGGIVRSQLNIKGMDLKSLIVLGESSVTTLPTEKLKELQVLEMITHGITIYSREFVVLSTLNQKLLPLNDFAILTKESYQGNVNE